jgi:uncharacterized protein YheU (UPF0270 family)
MAVLEGPPPIEIPFSSLSEDAGIGILNEFIEREGTDYGAAEASLEKKHADLIRQIEKGEVKLIFDPGTETVTLVTAREWRLRSKNSVGAAD